MKYYIGIDPGKTTGVAIWDGKKIVKESCPFFGALEIIDTWCQFNEENVEVVIEDPNLNRPTFNRYQGKRMDTKTILSMQKIAQNVGMNKRDAQLIIDYCQRRYVPYRIVKPTTTKWDAKMLETLTGITERTNQHVRDAIKLVYGL